VVVEDEDPEDRDLFGLWQSAEFMPDKITIFRKPLVEAFPDPRDLEEEIRITVLHELAHYFGIDEGRLDELGYS
jgi:predicted Zn-dependent protease with MMP-like domain